MLVGGNRCVPLIPFLRDLLCLILKILHCIVTQLQSVIEIRAA